MGFRVRSSIIGVRLFGKNSIRPPRYHTTLFKNLMFYWLVKALYDCLKYI